LVRLPDLDHVSQSCLLFFQRLARPALQRKHNVLEATLSHCLGTVGFGLRDVLDQPVIMARLHNVLHRQDRRVRKHFDINNALGHKRWDYSFRDRLEADPELIGESTDRQARLLADLRSQILRARCERVRGLPAPSK